MHLVMISLDEGMLNPDSAVAKRTLAYAELVESMHVVVYTPPGRQQRTLSPKITVIPTNSSTKPHFLRDAWRIWKRICSSLPSQQTVITTQDPFETALVWRWLKKQFGCGLHIQDHGNFFESTYRRKETLLNGMRWYMWWFLLKQANAIRVVSKIEQVYLENHGFTNVLHIPVYVDTSPKMTQRMPHVGCNLLMLSRFVPQKNILFALRVLEKLFKLYTDMTLVLVGKGPLEPAIRAYIKKHALDDRVVIKPWTNDVWNEYKNADIFLLPSLYEGRWMTVIEAASYGVPVIMTATWCAGDFLVDGYNGMVIPINDAEALSSSIITLYENKDLWEAYVTNGYQQLKKMFSREETLSRYGQSRIAALPTSQK